MLVAGTRITGAGYLATSSWLANLIPRQTSLAASAPAFYCGNLEIKMVRHLSPRLRRGAVVMYDAYGCWPCSKHQFAPGLNSWLDTTIAVARNPGTPSYNAKPQVADRS